jgi:hypothetical protein
MTSFRKLSDALRRWLVGAIREGVASPPPAKPSITGYRQLMRLTAARSLVIDGVTIEQAAAAAGVEPEDLQHYLSPRRGGARGQHK